MKPRVTATLWEDEGSMCFQVEAKGVCVARRDGTAPCIKLGFMRHRGLQPPPTFSYLCSLVQTANHEISKTTT